ncbi:MAG: phosphoenolpyruvate carboxylase [Gloeobacteraceae cyanobacterium ES-bin-316]|nr:phosphoenolpyruvate carboxylase [Ferruginibacter sp.]
MSDYQLNGLRQFKTYVGLKFQLYNSLFTGLPFHRIEKTGILLSLLLDNCEEGYKKMQSPQEIIETFFTKHTNFKSREEQLNFLFRLIQFIERQVVLFDALEDAAFNEVHDSAGPGSLRHLALQIQEQKKEEELAEKLKHFSVRMVLTAHPTQFYPGQVLGIIHDLSKAMAINDTGMINIYLKQLGKTPFFNKKKPTPYDEAVSLIWYLENVFYTASGNIVSFFKNQFPQALNENNSIINMGFWPGGDRDGNPFVDAATTLKVADALRGSIIKCYYQDVRRLKRRLTFSGIDPLLNSLEKKLYENIFIPGHRTALTQNEILNTLFEIKNILIQQHSSLFLHLVDNLVNKVSTFGLHFASLDVRQESSVHGRVLQAIAENTPAVPKNFDAMAEADKMIFLTSNASATTEATFADALVADTVNCIQTMKVIQAQNGERGSNRYIISQCNSALNVMEVFGLFVLGGWAKDKMDVDIVPLFETVDDLQRAGDIMKTLYENAAYSGHLKYRNHKQTIMLGFSDGTKDGGYLMANWSIYKAKEALSSISKEYQIDVVFFDGRGGPPARGGGKTHQFYASMGQNISNKEIQLTVQGQTVSSNFGTIDSAQFNIEQLIHAGISNELFHKRPGTLEPDEELLLQQLADDSFTSYKSLKNHSYFADYLSNVSPLRYYSETNIGSRPASRSASGKLSLKDFRAIPFVGSWSQLKQNVTGYYGVGSALQKADKQGQLVLLKALYNDSLFFKTLVDNCEMAMKKCYFPLTQYLGAHAKYGELWQMIHSEYELTKKYIFLLTGKNELMANYPVEQLSIAMRERIVLPLATIQQYAIASIRSAEENLETDPLKETFEKLVMRSSFGLINAGRNSA